MFKTKTFENNIYMKLFRLAYIFLAGNICFLIVNLPFFFVVVTTAMDPRNIFFFILSAVPFLPASLTLIAWLDEWKSEKDINPFQLYFKLYRKMWKQSFILGGVGFFLSIISLMNALLLSQFTIGKWFSFFFVILAVALVALVINNFYFFVKNQEIKMSVVYTTSIYFVIRKWYFSFLNVVLIIMSLLLMVLKPQFGFLLSPVLFFGLIYLNCTKLYSLKNVKE